jgi:dynein heavy chain
VQFGRGNRSVVGMTSSEGESFDFKSVVAIEGPVEAWMTGVEAEMRRTLFHITKQGVFFYAKACSAHAFGGGLGGKEL